MFIIYLYLSGVILSLIFFTQEEVWSTFVDQWKEDNRPMSSFKVALALVILLWPLIYIYLIIIRLIKTLIK